MNLSADSRTPRRPRTCSPRRASPRPDGPRLRAGRPDRQMCPKDGVIAGVIGNAKLLTALCALGALLATACSGSSTGATPTVSVAMTASSPGPTPTAPLSGIRGCSPECATGITNPGALPAGSYTTTYFLDGRLTLDIPPGWKSTEDQPVEFNAQPRGPHRVVFWVDPFPARFDEDGLVRPISGVPRTGAGAG